MFLSHLQGGLTGEHIFSVGLGFLEIVFGLFHVLQPRTHAVHGGGGGAHGLLQLVPSLQGGFVKFADNRPENIARAGDSFGPALAFC